MPFDIVLLMHKAGAKSDINSGGKYANI